MNKITLALLTIAVLLCGSILFADINEELIKCSAYRNPSERVLYSKKAAELISQGADVNVRNESGVPILGNAAYKGNYELVKILVENKANINIKNNDTGRTPLFLAIDNIGGSKEQQDNNFQVIKYLISKGADVNITDNYGNSCLMLASGSSFKRIDIMSLLISHGADVNAKDENGNTALSNSVSVGDISATKLLISKGSNLLTEDKPLLVNAVHDINYDMAKLLIEKGIDINQRDKFQATPLTWAEYTKNTLANAIKNGTIGSDGEITYEIQFMDGTGGTTCSSPLSKLKQSYKNIIKIEKLLLKKGAIRTKISH